MLFKNHKTVTIFIFILLTLLTLVFLEFNTSYELISKIPKIIYNQTGILFIGTHNYEHKDIFIILNSLKKLIKNFICFLQIKNGIIG